MATACWRSAPMIGCDHGVGTSHRPCTRGACDSSSARPGGERMEWRVVGQRSRRAPRSRPRRPVWTSRCVAITPRWSVWCDPPLRSLLEEEELYNKNPPTPCLWQAPASTQETKRKTRPAVRRSARWRGVAFFTYCTCQFGCTKSQTQISGVFMLGARRWCSEHGGICGVFFPRGGGGLLTYTPVPPAQVNPGSDLADPGQRFHTAIFGPAHAVPSLESARQPPWLVG